MTDMHISDFITVDRIACSPQASSKKRGLELLSELLVKGDPALAETEVFDCLLARERLGSTSIGHGVAIPHGRLANLEHTIAAFIRLEPGVDFDAMDGEAVDLLFAVAVPAESSEEHLQLLAALANLFADASLRERLRAAPTAEELHRLLTQAEVGSQRKAGVPHG